jgi:hypothetical protein
MQVFTASPSSGTVYAVDNQRWAVLAPQRRSVSMGTSNGRFIGNDVFVPDTDRSTFDPNDEKQLAENGGVAKADEDFIRFASSDVKPKDEQEDDNANPHEIGAQKHK